CENQVEKLGIKDRVKFVGLVDKYRVRELMNKADCFVHHSITGKDGDKEGLPTVIMEALAMQLPVISTYHAGIPELIEHEKNGLLTEEKDIDALADMMYRIREIEPMDYRKLIIDDFNLEKNTLNIIKIFEKVICEFKKRSNQRC
ncbi:MAG: glycosyltransferase, partial [Crenarchaeota archaeon]|nr:glycosyltransferase [Thermoproteota archaeon]